LQYWAKDTRIDAALLRQALSDVISIYEMTPPPSQTLKAEYLYIMRTLNSSADELFDENDVSVYVPSALRIPALFLYCEPEVNRRLTRLLFADELARADIPRHLRPSRPARSPAIERGLRRTLFAESLPETLVQADRGLQIERARHAGMMLILALQCHFREHGTFPESLDALLEGYLTALPIDPFGKGEPMRYGHDSSDERNVLVWSIGPDETDDAGLKELDFAASEFGDIVFKIEPPMSK